MNLTWTEEEKKKLLLALQEHGLENLELLAKELGKPISDIEHAITIYERAAIKAIKPEPGKLAPIDQWLDLFKSLAVNNKDRSKDIITFLKLITFQENRTESNVNLTECYKYLTDLMRGRATKQLDEETYEFLMNCLSRLGNMIKNQNIEKEKEFLDTLQSTRLDQKCYITKKSPVLSLPSINPLRIPLPLLQNKK